MSHWYDSTPKKSRRKRDSNPGSSAIEADALTTGPTRRSPRRTRLRARLTERIAPEKSCRAFKIPSGTVKGRQGSGALSPDLMKRPGDGPQIANNIKQHFNRPSPCLFSANPAAPTLRNAAKISQECCAILPWKSGWFACSVVLGAPRARDKEFHVAPHVYPGSVPAVLLSWGSVLQTLRHRHRCYHRHCHHGIVA